jgi:hypothetical protein
VGTWQWPEGARHPVRGRAVVCVRPRDDLGFLTGSRQVGPPRVLALLEG